MTATSTKNPAQPQGRFPLRVKLCWIIWGCSGRQIHPKSELHRLQERLRRQEIGNPRRKLILTNTREICRIAECEKWHNANSKGKIVKIAMFGAAVIIRGYHNRDKGTAENERLRNSKFIFSYPENERLVFLGGRNAAQKEISTMRVGWQPADRCMSLSALCVGRDIGEEIEWDCGKDLWVRNLRLRCSDRSDYQEKAE